MSMSTAVWNEGMLALEDTVGTAGLNGKGTGEVGGPSITLQDN